MVKDLVQTSLDAVLYSKNIYIHEQIKSGADADEYVVYSLSGDPSGDFADNEAITKSANVTIRYYYRSENLNNYATKQTIRTTEKLIADTLKEAGFSIPYGYFDGGDIDDIGFHTTIFECEYWRVV